MKLKISFKTPDVLHYALEDLEESEREAVRELCERWIKYGESITLEVDTKKETIRVVENS